MARNLLKPRDDSDTSSYLKIVYFAPSSCRAVPNKVKQTHLSKIMRLLPQTQTSSRPSKPAHWSRALLARSSAVCAAACLAAGAARADTLAGWDFDPLTGGANNFGPSPYAATESSATVTVGGLTRGGGVGTTGTAAGNAWGGNAWDGNATAAAAIAADDYVTFSVTATAGNTVSISSLGAFNVRRSGSGPASGQLQYQIGGGPFVDVGTTIAWGTGTSAAGNTVASIDLSGISALQNVSPGISVTFRIVAFGATGATGTFYLNDPAGTPGSDFTVIGTTAVAPTDTTPPTIATLSPANNEINVLAGANLVANFDELIQAGTGNIVITKTAGNVVFATIPVGDPQINISGTTLTINPTNDLVLGVNYYVTIPNGAIQDLAGNLFPGILSSGTWSFTTDGTPPTVLSFSPAAGASGVPSLSTLAITFDEQINAIGGNIVLKKANGDVVEAIPADIFSGVSVSGAVATIPLSAPLEYGVSYYVQIAADAFADNSGNAYAGILSPDTTTWAFATVNVPSLTGAPYTQTFSTYTSGVTLPLGWSYSGSPTLDTTYRGTWGTVTPDPGNPLATLGGFLGNDSVFGYHHTSLSNTTTEPLIQTLTLRNETGAPITDLSVAYKGRMNIPVNTRIPVYAVSVDGTAVTALGYSTADGDSAQRNASLTGLSIPEGATFQIKWSSAYPTGAGSARQIGISDVSVSTTSAVYAPTVAALSVPVGTIGSLNAPVQANVIGDGGQTLTGRGFVFSVTSVNPAPQIGGSGVTSIAVASPAVGAYSSTLTGLTPNTNYTVSAYATNASGTSYTAFTTFTSLAVSPTFVSSYTQAFDNYTGANPAGWTAISDAVPPLQTFAGNWGTTSTSGGFLGNVSGPGVLGYRHTASSGNLTVTLRLVNGTGAVLTSLNISYLGRVERTAEGRSPAWAVAVNGGSPVAALAYDTALNLDTTQATTVTGLSIAAGDEFSITWVSNRGPGSGSAKQIGIGAVSVSTVGPPNTLASWISGFSVGAETGVNGDFDKDGLSNAVENILGSNPSVSNTGITVVSGTATSLVFRHNRSTTPASDLTPSYEWSTDLATWYPAGTGGGVTVSITPVVITPGGPTDLVEVTASVVSGTAGKLFCRLKVTNP